MYWKSFGRLLERMARQHTPIQPIKYALNVLSTASIIPRSSLLTTDCKLATLKDLVRVVVAVPLLCRAESLFRLKSDGGLLLFNTEPNNR